MNNTKDEGGGGALAKRETHEVAARTEEPSIGMMLQAVLERGVTETNVAAVGQLVQLYERMQDRDAEKAFAAAFNALQSETCRVEAVRAVPNNDGTVRYRFAPYEEIMKVVKPLLERHGFTVTFNTDYAEGRIIKECVLQHVGGHKRSNKYAVRIGKGPPGSTETQADGAASTYAKRGALCDALNIVVERDDDAGALGGTVTADQAWELERRVSETNTDRARFLKFAQAESFAEIPAKMYAVLDAQLAKKERGR